jgi:ATP-binding cassette subfamily B (MDR/TAP) protein 1
MEKPAQGSRDARVSSEAQQKDHVHEEKEKQRSEEHPGRQLSATAAYFKLWTYASSIDSVARLAATASALGAGSVLPLMAIIFGNFVNAFNGWARGTVSPDDFVSSVNSNAIYLVYLWIARFVLSYLGALLYNLTSSRIVRKIRLQYLTTVIHQPIAYFDTHSTGSISTNLATDVNLVEVGLGEKISTVFQGSSMIITAFVIGLTKNWKLTLACLTVIPYNAIVTGTLVTIDTRIEGNMKAIYSEASTVVEEVLSSICNVTALGAVDKIVRRFEGYVKQATKRLAFHGAIWASLYGNMFFAMHCVYALCLFYGVKLVQNGEIADGGTVMTVMFCVIMGSSSLVRIGRHFHVLSIKSTNPHYEQRV